MRGRIDRLDHGPGARRELLDYKTSSVDSLRQRVREPLEDTQLAFYAALVGADENLGAAYLALDDARAPLAIEHPEVQRSAAALLAGLGGESVSYTHLDVYKRQGLRTRTRDELEAVGQVLEADLAIAGVNAVFHGCLLCRVGSHAACQSGGALASVAENRKL